MTTATEKGGGSGGGTTTPVTGIETETEPGGAETDVCDTDRAEKDQSPLKS